MSYGAAVPDNHCPWCKQTNRLMRCICSTCSRHKVTP